MAVVLANAQLTVDVRAHQWVRDARGVPMPSARDVVESRGPYPGNVTEQADGSYAARLDPRVWPVRAGDSVTDGTRTWIVAAPDPILHELPAAPVINHVEARLTLDPPKVP